MTQEPNSTSLTFAGFPACADPAAARARVVIAGAPHATPYEPGVASHSARAPAAIRAAIRDYAAELHHFDFDLGGPIVPDGEARVVDCGDLAGDPSDAAGNRARIDRFVRAVLASGAVPVVIGGDDSVPIPVIGAYQDRGPLTVVQIDAHIDWRDDIGGERYGYSSTMRRASEMPWVERIVQVGMRGVGSARPAEFDDARAWGARIVTAREVHRAGVDRVLAHIPAGASCLVTIDCDGLDPSIMPAVLAPAPGGLGYQQTLDVIHGVARKARLVGFDLVEFAPERDVGGLAALTAARLVCNAIGMAVRSP